MNEKDREAKARADIEQHGCHVLKVLSDGIEPPFAYSIGIEATSQQPDLLVVGLDLNAAHQIINEYNRRVRAGKTFVPNTPYYGLIVGFPVFFGLVQKKFYSEYLGWGLWFYNGDSFRTMQLVYPDTSGHWPWDKAANDTYRKAMPLLCQTPVLISEI